MGFESERDEVIESAAHYLGFTRLRDSVIDPIKSAINAAIRRDLVEYDGSTIWRN